MINNVVELSDKTIELKELASLVDDNVTVLRLTNVELAGSDDYMYNFATKIRGHPSIQEFNMNSVTFADPTLTMDHVVSCLLVSAARIEKLVLLNTPVTSTTISIACNCPTLKKLEIPQNQFTDADAVKIANALADAGDSSNSIETINLSGNKLSDLGCKAFETCLDKNKSLKIIKLEGNSAISGDEFNKIEAKLMGRAATAA